MLSNLDFASNLNRIATFATIYALILVNFKATYNLSIIHETSSMYVSIVFSSRESTIEYQF